MNRYLWIVIAAAIGLLATTAGLPGEANTVFAIALIAGVLWFSEAVPLHVTALAIPFLLVLFTNTTFKSAFAPLADPVVILLLGGFVLARGLEKYKLDEEIAYYFIGKIGTSAKKFLFGMMLVAAFLSMWMSNTATTAIMIPIALVVLRKSNLKKGSSYGKAVVLGVAYAATIGGLATIVGTTPNAIAVKFLAENGIQMTFTSWMAHALPFVVVFLPIVWFLLLKLHKPEIKNLTVHKRETNLNSKQKMTLGIFALTVLLWLTTEFHPLSTYMVAVVPIFLFYLLGLFDTEDISKVHWPVLLLIGGGLSLGLAIAASGLDTIAADVIAGFLAGQVVYLMFFGVIAFAILMTLVTSNTGAASFMVPVVIPLALALGVPLQTVVLLAGLGVSLDFIVPVGTPPNAIAYGTGYVRMKDMVISGSVIALLGSLLLAGFAMLW